MATSYRKIKSTIWADEKFSKMSISEKLVFFWLITNRHAHSSGIYHFSPDMISMDTGVSLRHVSRILKNLGQNGLVELCFQDKTVWVKGMFLHQGSTMKRILATKEHLKTIHFGQVKHSFMANFKDLVNKKCKDKNKEGNEHKEKEKEKERERETLSRFDIFWKAYPNKKAKQDARAAWKKLNPGPDLLTEILTAVEVQKKTKQWQEENGKFIPLPASWLRGHRWEDDVTEITAQKSLLDQQYEKQKKALRERQQKQREERANGINNDQS